MRTELRLEAGNLVAVGSGQGWVPPAAPECRMTVPDSVAFVDALRAAFCAHADPVRAAPMQAYMKSAMPFLGIPAPLRRRLTAEVVAAHPAADAAALARTMSELWGGARFRE